MTQLRKLTASGYLRTEAVKAHFLDARISLQIARTDPDIEIRVAAADDAARSLRAVQREYDDASARAHNDSSKIRSGVITVNDMDPNLRIIELNDISLLAQLYAVEIGKKAERVRVEFLSSQLRGVS